MVGLVLVALEDVGVVDVFFDGVDNRVVLAHMAQVKVGFSCLVAALDLGLLLDFVPQSQ